MGGDLNARNLTLYIYGAVESIDTPFKTRPPEFSARSDFG